MKITLLSLKIQYIIVLSLYDLTSKIHSIQLLTDMYEI